MLGVIQCCDCIWTGSKVVVKRQLCTTPTYGTNVRKPATVWAASARVTKVRMITFANLVAIARVVEVEFTLDIPKVEVKRVDHSLCESILDFQTRGIQVNEDFLFVHMLYQLNWLRMG